MAAASQSEIHPDGPDGGTHTAAEIAQQPALWDALADALETDHARIDAFLGDWLARPGHRVILTGAGSSGFIAEMAADAIDAQWPAEVRALHTTSLLTHPQLYLQRERPTLLVSFARSGSSPESIAAVDLVRERVDVTRFLDITCNPQGGLAVRGQGREDTCTVLMPEGSCDRAFAMTSSLSCMVLAALAVLDASPWPQRLQRLRQLATSGRQALDRWNPEIAALAQEGHGRIIYLGSGPLEGLAREAALKMLELSAGRVLAMANTPLGFRHGPKSALDAGTTVVVLRSVEPLARLYEQDLLDELRADGVAGRVLAVGPEAGPADPADLLLLVPALPEAWLAPLWLTMAQRLALLRSAALGLTPDNPFPDGTVNRVVQGVTLHS